MRPHDFYEQLNLSKEQPIRVALKAYLKAAFDDFEWVRPADEFADLQGVDFWLILKGGRRLGIDLKFRSFDPLERYDRDDICIETTSVYNGACDGKWVDEKRKAVGWTLDTHKRTDYVVYAWLQSTESYRFWGVYFPLLREVALKYWKDWCKTYGELSVRNKNYLTLCIFPPRSVVMACVQEEAEKQHFEGKIFLPHMRVRVKGEAEQGFWQVHVGEIP